MTGKNGEIAMLDEAPGRTGRASSRHKNGFLCYGSPTATRRCCVGNGGATSPRADGDGELLDQDPGINVPTRINEPSAFGAVHRAYEPR